MYDLLFLEGPAWEGPAWEGPAWEWGEFCPIIYRNIMNYGIYYNDLLFTSENFNNYWESILYYYILVWQTNEVINYVY